MGSSIEESLVLSVALGVYLGVPLIHFQNRQDRQTDTHTHTDIYETNTPCLRALVAFSFITARPFVTSTSFSFLKRKESKRIKKNQKGSKRIKKNQTESKRIKQNQKEPTRIKKNQKESKCRTICFDRPYKERQKPPGRLTRGVPIVQP